ncbi:MAG: NUDIX domain-containing protein [Puniceicoccaceae bacterium]
MTASLPYRIATLIFMEHADGRQLLLQRRKAPNQGLWTPIGGKLETSVGESPVQCAVREVREEAGVHIQESELHLFGYLAEKAYEHECHWLIFLFHCHQKLHSLPEAMDEGSFAFHARQELHHLPMAQPDREILWPTYWKHRDGFTGIRVEYHDLNHNPQPFTITIESGSQANLAAPGTKPRKGPQDNRS